MMRAARLALVLLAGCDWSLQRMLDQQRCDTDEPSALFADGRCNQAPPQGVVAYAPQQVAQPAPSSARAALRQRIAHGHERFDVFCAPCHGLLGDGRSRVAESMTLRKPPDLTGERVAAMSDEYVARVIAQGFGLMPSYAGTLDEVDRRALVAYLRVLALSQDVALARLPERARQEARAWLR